MRPGVWLRRVALPLMAALLLAAACAPRPTAALFEEQAGLQDWRVAHVGGVTSLLLRPATSSAIVSTSENVLASIALSGGGSGAASGETRWRQVLPEGETLAAMASYSKTRALTVSTNAATNGIVRMWNTADGSLVWDAALDLAHTEEMGARMTAALTHQKRRVQGTEPVDTYRAHPFAFTHAEVLAVADATADGKRDILVLHGNQVALLNGVDGTLVWSWTKANFAGLRIAAHENHIAVVGQDSTQPASIIVYSLNKQGKEGSSRSFPAPSSLSQRTLLVASNSLFLLDATTKSLASVHLFSASKEVVTNLAQVGVTSTVSHMELIGTSHLVAYAEGQQATFEISAVDASIKRTNAFTSPKGVDVEYTLARDDDGKSTFVVRATLAKSKLTVESFAIGGTTSAHTLVANQPFAHRGGLKQIWVDLSSGASQASGARVLVSCVDDSLSLFQHGTLQWTREEALASMTRIQYVELPAGSGDVDDESAGTYPNFFQRFFPQLVAIVRSVVHTFDPVLVSRQVMTAVANLEKTFLTITGAPVTATVSTATDNASFARPLARRARHLTQDYFGFRKLLLATTESGKVYALESESGQVVWSKFLRAGVTDEDANEEDEQVTPVWKVHVVSHHEAVAIVHDEAHTGTSRKSHLIAFNPLTGDLIKGASMDVDFLITSSIVLPFHDSHNRHIILVASAGASQVRAFPNTEEVRKLVQQKANSIYFYTADTDAQVLQGFHLQSSGNTFTAVATWTSHFPSDQERIVSIAGRLPNEVVQSSVRVLGGGEGGYLYKYLNPNLLAIATVRSAPSASTAANLRVVPSLKRTTDPSVNLYLLDTITGAILDKFVHRGCEGPVTVLQSENTILYHYFNAAQHQYELSTVELYETRDATTASTTTGGIVPQGGSIFDGFTLSSLGHFGRSSVSAFNSFEEPSPQSIQQTYTFKSALKTIGVTQTRRGITQKDFLLGLPSDQLYALPRMLVDARRPVGEPTMLDRMEGLIPYTAEVPIDPLRIVTHTHTIGHLKAVTASHALLESTSLVCAHGIDLFCTRLTPSQTFDLLNEDFNSPFLIATVTAVFAAIYFTRRMARAKELKAAWK